MPSPRSLWCDQRSLLQTIHCLALQQLTAPTCMLSRLELCIRCCLSVSSDNCIGNLALAKYDGAAQMQTWHDQKHASHLLTVTTSAIIDLSSLFCLCGELAQNELSHGHCYAMTTFTLPRKNTISMLQGVTRS